VIVKLPYARDTVTVDLRGLKVRPLLPSAPRGAVDRRRLVARALENPIDGLSLRELASGRRTAIVVVPDATREIGLPVVLPAILDRLSLAGIESRAVTVLLACGTHPPVAPESAAALIGELSAGVAVRQHDSRDTDALAVIGDLRPGVPLRLDAAAAAADLLITVGVVRHHYFAGFGGGPKMIFPGIAGYSEIQANHALVLRRTDSGIERHPGCEPGRLEDNPVALEIARAADLRPPDLAVCLVPGRDGNPAWVGAGSWRAAFFEAVTMAREWYELPPERFDMVVAGGGGRPGDATLIQAHKALDAACRFAHPGAEVLFAAELGEGAGSSAMTPFLADPRPEAVMERLASEYVQYGHTTLRIVEKTARFKVYLKSSLDPELAHRLGFHPVDDLSVVAERWRSATATGRVAVLAEGAVWPRL